MVESPASWLHQRKFLKRKQKKTIVIVNKKSNDLTMEMGRCEYLLSMSYISPFPFLRPSACGLCAFR